MASKRGNSEVSKSPSETNTVNKRSTRQKMKRCNVCCEQVPLNFVEEELATVMCRKCSDRYHCKCVGISSQFFYNLIQNSKKGWLCYSCSSDSFKFVEKLEERLTNIERQVQINTQNVQQITSSIEHGFRSMDEKYQAITERLLQEIDSLKNKIHTDGLALSNDEIVKSVTEATLKNLQGSVNSVSHNNDIKYIHALQRKNNLMIHNVPQEQRETKEALTNKILKLCSSLGVAVQHQNITIVMRLNNKLPTQNNLQHETPVVLVKFCDAAIKDEIFDAYLTKIMNKTPLTQQAFGHGSTQRVYVNHHLSPELASLKKKAIELKKEGKIDKVNARYNNIRVNVNNTWHKIDTHEALLQLTVPCHIHNTPE